MWLAKCDDFITEKLLKIVKYPEIKREQSQELLIL